jgi:hypothetical protein
VTAEPTRTDIHVRLTQGVQWDVAPDEVTRVPLGHVESRPSAPTANVKQTVAGRQGQNIAEGLRLLDGRKAVDANFVPQDRTLDAPGDLAAVLSVLVPESVERVRLVHGPMIPALSPCPDPFSHLVSAHPE